MGYLEGVDPIADGDVIARADLNSGGALQIFFGTHKSKINNFINLTLVGKESNPLPTEAFNLQNLYGSELAKTRKLKNLQYAGPRETPVIMKG